MRYASMIEVVGLEGHHAVEVIPRGHALKDGEVVRRGHGARWDGGRAKAAIGLGSRP